MRMARFGTLMIVLVILSFINSILLAQDENNIDIVGSSIVNDLLASAYGDLDAEPNVQVIGTARGFQEFCQGNADVALGIRYMNQSESDLCDENGVEFLEFLIGHNILTFVSNPDDEVGQCLTLQNIDAVFAPSATGQEVNWQDFTGSNPELPVTVFIPEDSPALPGILDRITSGDGIRNDLETSEDVISGVAETPGALGIVGLSTALDAGDSVNIIDVNFGSSIGCVEPSVTNVALGLYPGVDRLSMYVNTESLANQSLADLVEVFTGDTNNVFIASQGLVSLTDEHIQRNSEILADSLTGRQFSQPFASYTIPFDLSGEVVIGGSASDYQFFERSVSALAQRVASLQAQFDLLGEARGLEQLCSNENDLVVSINGISDDAQALCDENDVTLVTIPVGTHATVLVANAENEDAQCLTADQLLTIWGSASTDAVSDWSEIDPSFAERELILFASSAGDPNSEMLLLNTPNVPLRPDTEQDIDPLYRAAATANVEGGLSYMSWNDFQTVLENGQENISLVAIDFGDGCITPDEDNILSGEYPLSQQTQLITSQTALGKQAVQSLIWFIVSNENFNLLRSAGFVGSDLSSLYDLRQELLDEFAAADELAGEQLEAPEIEVPSLESDADAEDTTDEESDDAATEDDAASEESGDSTDATEETDEATEEPSSDEESTEESEDTSDTTDEESTSGEENND